MSASPEAHPCWWDEPYDDAWTLADRLRHRAALNRELPALLVTGDEPRVLTHGEIARRSAPLRAALLDAAGSARTVIACMVAHSLSSYVATYAVLTSGHTITMVDPRGAIERERSCLRRCEAQLIVTDRATRSRAEELAEGRIPVIVQEDCPPADGGTPRAALPTEPAALVFTSGSSGEPKAVVRTQRDLLHAIYSLSKTYGYLPRDVMMTPGAPGHIGTMNDVLCCLLVGFTGVPLDVSGVDVLQLIRVIQRHEVSVLSAPPSLLRVLLHVVDARDWSLPLRLIITSGEALARTDVALFHAVLGSRTVLRQNYGSTETGPMYSGCYEAEDAEGEGPLLLTDPAHACRIEILDDAGRPCPPGAVGHVLVRTSYLAAGYVGASPEEEARFVGDERGRGFLIGDQGRISADGVLELLGRGDRQISVRGHRVELGEVEAAIHTIPGVLEAVALQEPGTGDEPLLAAFIQPVPEHELHTAALRDALATKLPAVAIPHRLSIVEAMPRTASGKVNQAALHAIAQATAEPTPERRGGKPKGLLENWLADCWQSVLDVPRPGREDRFDELGGDSLAAIRLSAMFEQRFGVRIPLDSFLESPTIASQVAAFATSEPVEPQVLVPLREQDAGPVVVLLPGAGGHAWGYADLSQRADAPGSFLAVSYPSLLEGLRGSPSRDDIARRVVEAIRPHFEAGRLLVVAGYSLGGLIACDVACAAAEEGHAANRVLLLDPVVHVTPTSKLRIKKRIRELVQRLRPAGQAEVRSEAAKRFETEMRRRMHRLARVYRDARLVDPGVRTATLLSATWEGRDPQQLPGFLKAQEVCSVPDEHLELLRRPVVDRTATWVAERLVSPVR